MSMLKKCWMVWIFIISTIVAFPQEKERAEYFSQRGLVCFLAQYKDFSPLHNISKGAPPTILFLGTRDHLIPVETARYYQKVMERVGSRCDLMLYEGEEHGFFNYAQKYNYYQTVLAADQFLQSLGYPQDEPTLQLNN